MSTVFVTEAYIDRAGEALVRGLERYGCGVAFVRVECKGQPIRIIEPGGIDTPKPNGTAPESPE